MSKTATVNNNDNVNTTTTLTKSERLPSWLLHVFSSIDKGDFEEVAKQISDDIKVYFANYEFHGMKQSLGFIGTFDRRLPRYEHQMTYIYVSDDGNTVHFEGNLKVWLSKEDDSSSEEESSSEDDVKIISTPFWDKCERDPKSGKIKTLYALFSIAAFPEKYWKDMNPNDYL